MIWLVSTRLWLPLASVCFSTNGPAKGPSGPSDPVRSRPERQIGQGLRDAPLTWMSPHHQLTNSERDQWGRLTTTAAMGRRKDELARYFAFSDELRETWASTSDFLKHRVFGWEWVVLDGAGGNGLEAQQEEQEERERQQERQQEQQQGLPVDERALLKSLGGANPPPAAAASVLAASVLAASASERREKGKRVAVRPPPSGLPSGLPSAPPAGPWGGDEGRGEERRIVYRANDFPYWFEPGVTHDLIWVSS